MDHLSQILFYIINTDFKKIYIILDIKFKQFYINTLYYLMYMHSNKLYPEKYIFCFILILLKNSIMDISDVCVLNNYIVKYNTYTKQFTNFLIKQHDKYKKFSNMVNFIIYTKSQFGKELSNDNDDILYKNTLIKYNNIFNSYYNNFIVSIHPNEDILSFINRDEWFYIQTNEMIFRMTKCTKIFGIMFLQYCKINVISVNEFIDAEYLDRVAYYLMFMNNINDMMNIIIKITKKNEHFIKEGRMYENMYFQIINNKYV